MKHEMDELTILATKLPKAEADLFRQIAAERGTTVSRMLSDYVRSVLDPQDEFSRRLLSNPNTVVLHPNTLDKLKNAVSFHNPLGLSPDNYADRILSNVLSVYVDRPKRKG